MQKMKMEFQLFTTFTSFCLILSTGKGFIIIETEVIPKIGGGEIETEIPLNPSIIHYVAQSLTREECETVYAMLVAQDSSRKLSKHFNASSATKQYMEVLEKVKQRLQGNNPLVSFDCFASLSFWNTQLAALTFKDDIDKRDLAETLLRVSLSNVGRKDLDKWVHSQIAGIEHVELEKLKHQIENHATNATSYNQRPKHFSRETDMDLFVALLSVFFILGFSLLCLLLILETCFTQNAPGSESEALLKKTAGLQNPHYAYQSVRQNERLTHPPPPPAGGLTLEVKTEPMDIPATLDTTKL